MDREVALGVGLKSVNADFEQFLLLEQRVGIRVRTARRHAPRQNQERREISADVWGQEHETPVGPQHPVAFLKKAAGIQQMLQHRKRIHAAEPAGLVGEVLVEITGHDVQVARPSRLGGLGIPLHAGVLLPGQGAAPRDLVEGPAVVRAAIENGRVRIDRLGDASVGRLVRQAHCALVQGSEIRFEQ